MKRVFPLVLILLLVFLFVPLVGCGENPGPAEETALPSASPADNTEAPLDTPVATDSLGVPEQVIFNGVGEYLAFAASLELDDAGFQEFLNSGSYDMNGVNTREDAEKVLTALRSVPFPEAEGFFVYRISLRFDTDNFYIHLKSADNEDTSLCFDMSITPTDGGAEDLDLNGGTVELPVGDSSDIKYLVRAVDNVSDDGESSYYFTYIRSHRTRIITNIAEDALIRTLRGCRFICIDECAEVADASIFASLLPEWEPYSVSEDGMGYSYRGVTREMFGQYVESCVENGFRYIRAYDDTNSEALLYKDGLWIELGDNTFDSDELNPPYCGLHFYPSKSKGLTEEAALAAIGGGGTGKEPAAALDITPDGLYENTGARIFRVLYDLRPDRHPYHGKNYVERHFMLAGGEALQLDDDNSPYSTAFFGDVDGDGSSELLIGVGAPFSYYPTLGISVWRVGESGLEPLEGSKVVLPINGRGVFVSHDGRAYFSFAPKTGGGGATGDPITYGEATEYEIVLADGRLGLKEPPEDLRFYYDGSWEFVPSPIEW